MSCSCHVFELVSIHHQMLQAVCGVQGVSALDLAWQDAEESEKRNLSKNFEG